MSISKKRVSLCMSLVAAVVMSIVFISNALTISAQKQIEMTFQTIETQVEESLKFDGKFLVNGLPLALSSNPYDFISNNPEYDKLVAMGLDAIEALESCLLDTERYNGFERYIIAIAIEEINKVNLKNFDEYHWESGDTFVTAWSEIKEDAIDVVPLLISDESLSAEQKRTEISKFGLLAIEPLEKINADSSSTPVIEDVNVIINYISTSSEEEVIRVASENIN